MPSIYQNLVKDLNQPVLTPKKAIQIVRKHGLRKLGSGAFSTTYGKKDLPFVVKINQEHDPGAFQFYKTISQKSSKHFPRIHRLQTNVDDRGRFFFIAVVERLDELNEDKWQQQLNQGSKNFIHWLAQHPHSLMSIPAKDDRRASQSWSNSNRDSAKLILSMLSHVEKFGTADFHEANVMVRMPQGDAVLTDPVCTYIGHHDDPDY